MINPDVQAYIDKELLKLKAELTVALWQAPNSVIPPNDKKYVIPKLHEALAAGDYENILNGSIRMNTPCYVASESIKGRSL